MAEKMKDELKKEAEGLTNSLLSLIYHDMRDAARVDLERIVTIRAALSESAQEEKAAEARCAEWKALADNAISVLQRHLPPDGISDHEALNELYGIFSLQDEKEKR